MGAKKDQTGKKYGRLTVLKQAGKNKYGYILWYCKCDCGKEVVVNGNELRNGRTQSCGCLKKERSHIANFKNEINNRYGKLTVIKLAQNRIRNKIAWECLCDCGNTVIVLGDSLRNGSTKSCGCLKSIGQTKIQLILRQNNITYEKEKTFQTCRFKDTNQLARFDFYINNQYLIEYDGEQHFHAKNSGWNNNQKLEKTQKNDIFKNQWCKNNNIPLIRIPYTHLEKLALEDLLIETSNFII